MATTAKSLSSLEISGLVQSSLKKADNLSQLSSEDSRKTALAIVRSLVDALEKPEDVAMQYIWEVLLPQNKSNAIFIQVTG